MSTSNILYKRPGHVSKNSETTPTPMKEPEKVSDNLKINKAKSQVQLKVQAINNSNRTPPSKPTVAKPVVPKNILNQSNPESTKAENSAKTDADLPSVTPKVAPALVRSQTLKPMSNKPISSAVEAQVKDLKKIQEEPAKPTINYDEAIQRARNNSRAQNELSQRLLYKRQLYQPKNSEEVSPNPPPPQIITTVTTGKTLDPADKEVITGIWKKIDELKYEARASVEEIQFDEVIRIVKELQENIKDIKNISIYNEFAPLSQKLMAEFLKIIKAKQTGKKDTFSLAQLKENFFLFEKKYIEYLGEQNLVEEKRKSKIHEQTKRVSVRESRASVAKRVSVSHMQPIKETEDQFISNTPNEKKLPERTKSALNLVGSQPVPKPLLKASLNDDSPKNKRRSRVTSQRLSIPKLVPIEDGASKRVSRELRRQSLIVPLDSGKEQQLLAQIAILQKENSELNSKLGGQNNQVQELEKIKVEQAQQFTKLQRASSYLRDMSDTNKNELVKLRTELSLAQKEIESKKAENLILAEKETSIQESLKKAQIEIKELNTKLQTRTSNITTNKKDQSDELDKLRNQVKQLQQECSKLSVEKNFLQDSEKEIKKRSEKQLSELQSKMKQIESTNSSYQAKFEGLKDEIYELRKELNSNSAELDTKDKAIKNLTLENEDLSRKCKLLVDQLNEVCYTNEKNEALVNEHLANLENELEVAESENEAKESEIQTLVGTNQLLIIKLRELGVKVVIDQDDLEFVYVEEGDEDSETMSEEEEDELDINETEGES